MRHTRFLAAILALTSLAGTAEAQLTGGQDPTRAAQNRAPRESTGSFVRGGLLAPTGDYGKTSSGFAAIANGGGALNGFFVEFGAVRYLDLALPQNLTLGVEYGGAFGGMFVDWEDAIPDVDDWFGDLLGDITVGPRLTYKLADNLHVDGALRLGLGFAGGRNASGSFGEVTQESVGVGLATQFGLTLRYGRFGLGWAASSISADRTFDFDASGPSDSRDVSTAISTSRLFVTIGR
jgi:hypothetical protein